MGAGRSVLGGQRGKIVYVCGDSRYVAAGLYLEPLAHPKPGGVTRCLAQEDKDVYSFVASAFAGQKACLAACSGECRGFMARGIRAYVDELERLGVGTNIQLGSVLLVLPLCRAVSGSSTPRELARNASRLVIACDDEEAGREYYRALERLGVRHLGRYEGPYPGVGSGEYPRGLSVALIAGRWDLVHRELLEGYPATLEAYRVIMESGGPLREDALLRAILAVLASRGDTLIASRHGGRAYKMALWEARAAYRLSERIGVRKAIEWLQGLWRGRGWSPGAALDVVAAAAGIAFAVSAGVLVEG